MQGAIQVLSDAEEESLEACPSRELDSRIETMQWCWRVRSRASGTDRRCQAITVVLIVRFQETAHFTMLTTTHTRALAMFRRPPTGAYRVPRDVAALSVNHGEMRALRVGGTDTGHNALNAIHGGWSNAQEEALASCP